MERIQKLLIIVFLILSLIPAFYVNRWLQLVIRPRRSIGQLFLYVLACFVLVFAYSFLVVLIISKLFPLAKR